MQKITFKTCDTIYSITWMCINYPGSCIPWGYTRSHVRWSLFLSKYRDYLCIFFHGLARLVHWHLTLSSLCSLCDASKGKDDITGEPLIQHDDDKPEALTARLRHYKDVAKPVIDLYKSVNSCFHFLQEKLMHSLCTHLTSYSPKNN